MSDRFKQLGLAAMSGENRSPAGALLRSATALVEPGYATAMRLRNWLYDTGLKKSYDLGRPAISVGNLTTGGTGKTPVVSWLARQLLLADRKPAVLLRGYGTDVAHQSDELQVLRRSLGDTIPVHANPSRVTGAEAVLRESQSVDVFVLDDAYQHRRAVRSFDLVLVSATNPFGFGHVLPRGLMREPASGLRRADAIVLTRSDAADEDLLADIERQVRQHNRSAPIYRADHVHSALWDLATGVERPITALESEPFFAVAGIGDPAALDHQLRRFGDAYRGHRWFVDHHAYTTTDAKAIRAEAGSATLVTTEKDWVKLSEVVGPNRAGWGVLRLDVRFRADHGRRLLTQILAAL